MAPGHLTSFTRILLPVVVFLIAAACRYQAKKTGFTAETLYAEYKGSNTAGSITSTIHRKLFLTGWGERRLVISEISRITDMGSFRMSSSRKLTELRINDTLFCFDSADSTFWRISLAEAEKLNEKEFPFSALWLLKSWNIGNTPLIPENNETYNDLKKVKSGEKLITLRGELPISAHSAGPDNICTEELVKIVTDTLLSDELFRLPAGYRLLRPSTDACFSKSNK